MAKNQSFTGRRRRRVTRWTVALNDRIARTLIAVGGIGTIIAVSLVCLFLLWVVIPLFLPTSAEPHPALALKVSDGVLAFGADDYNLTTWIIGKDGSVRIVRLDNGEQVQALSPQDSSLEGISTSVVAIDGQSALFGFENGTVRLGKIDFGYDIVAPDQVPEQYRKIKVGEIGRLDDGALLTRTGHGEIRRQKFSLKLQPAVSVSPDSRIARLDFVTRGADTRFASLSADGKVRMNLIGVTHNNLTDEDETELSAAELKLPESIKSPPDYLLISELGDAVFAAWRDGRLLRFETRNVEKSRFVEEVDLVTETGHSLTALTMLLGRNTLVSGDSLGRIQGWFTKEAASSGRVIDDVIPADGHILVAAHEFAGVGQAVTSIAASPRSRLVAAGFANGETRLLYVAAERMLAEVNSKDHAAIDQLAISPKGDAVLAATPKGISWFAFDARHPEATLGMLFTPVWYEGRQGPENAWQSTGSSDASEAKFGLMPLVFGTLKATVYTMLFGAPLALLAAIYSSEFLHPRLKQRIKPMIEMMASLPSVVLGFLAGLIIAPFVEGIVPEVLTCVFVVPLTLLSAAYLWQLLPSNLVVRLSRFRLVFIMAVLPIGVWIGFQLGPLVERLLFAGNVKEWLDGQIGSGTGGWVLLLLPLAGLFTAVMFSQQVNPWLRRKSGQWTRMQGGLVELVKFAGGVVFTIAAAWFVAWALNEMKLDPRGTFVGTYVQRNALIVGFAMAFAIIPLIYTIADDALSTVPEHLRSASLGAGATPWQTAVRIVIPTAASGLFSALMIGLGRAVGETMIVLMAAGNTPIMDWNIFQGFETLSMALATELPEAAKNSTHYRVLFLAALTLFAVTFVVNTVAEVVRQRFRRRAYEL
jgi:phosphate transport system permease protein